MEKEMSDACVAQWLQQSTGNRKTWTRIPAQSKASFFHRKIFKFFEYYNYYYIYLDEHFSLYYTSKYPMFILSEVLFCPIVLAHTSM